MGDKVSPESIKYNLGRNFISIPAYVGMFFLNFIGRIIFAPLMPTIEQDLGLTHSQAGSLFFLIAIIEQHLVTGITS